MGAPGEMTPAQHREWLKEPQSYRANVKRQKVKQAKAKKKASSGGSGGGGCAVAAIGVGAALLTGLAAWKGWA